MSLNNPKWFDIVNLTELVETAISTDLVIVRDVSESSNKKITVENLTKKVAFKPNNTVQTLSEGGALSIDANIGMQRIKTTSSAGQVNISGTPFGTGGGWIDGARVEIVGTSDATAPTLVHSNVANGAILNGNFSLTRYSRIVLEWDQPESRWVEVSRNN